MKDLLIFVGLILSLNLIACGDKSQDALPEPPSELLSLAVGDIIATDGVFAAEEPTRAYDHLGACTDYYFIRGLNGDQSGQYVYTVEVECASGTVLKTTRLE